MTLIAEIKFVLMLDYLGKHRYNVASEIIVTLWKTNAMVIAMVNGAAVTGVQ